ncbi:MAG: hypothetical protein Kow00121_10540 [Elainellaceae cyanobacterium]
MVKFDRRRFLQLMTSTIATVGLNTAGWQQQGLQYARVLAQPTRRKRALLVGINEYPDSPLFTPLKGCVQDVEMQQALLMHRFGFSQGDIVTLINQDATRQNILNTFHEFLIQPCQEGDVVVFHFSGHGRRILDPDPLRTAAGEVDDRLNSTLVPSDDGAIGENGEVSDIMGKTLFLLTSQLKTDHVTIVLDSCYAGGGIRGNTRVRSARGGEGYKPSRAELTNQQRWREALGISDEEFRQLRDLGIAKGIAIAAAQRNQKAVDVTFDGFDAGAFTYFLTQFLWHEAESVESVVANVTRNLQEEAFYQTPLGCVAPFQCDPSQQRSQPLPIYFVTPQETDQAPAEAVIQSVSGDRATIWLGGGDPNSIVTYGAGAEFIPAGQTEATEQPIRVLNRNGLTAEVLLPSSLPTGTLLQESARVIPRDVQLAIGLDPSLAAETIAAQQAFAALGDRFALVLPLESGTYPTEVQYILSRLTDRYLELVDAANQEHPPQNSIVLFSPSLDEIIPGSHGEAGEAVEVAIERLAAKFNALYAARLMKLALNANSARPNALNVTAEIEIPEGRSTAAQAFTVRGARTTPASTSETLLEMELEAIFQFVVTNREPDDLHVVVLVVDRTGDITPILPNQFTASVDETLIQSGQTKTIPAPGSGLELRASTKGIGEALILVSRNSPRQALLAVRNDQRSSNIPVVDALLADVEGVELSRSSAGDRQVATAEVAGFSIPFRVV